MTGKDCCGEYRNVVVEQKLEFVLRGGCELKVSVVDEIRAQVRLDWTLEEFYADGGVTTFVDRLAGVLGIHASTIKVARVYEGSVMLEFTIEPDMSETQVDDNVAANYDEDTLAAKQ